MVRLGFIIGFIALVGVLLSGLAAYRVHDQELTVDGIALARAIDVHASLVQDRLTERELLARVASGLFRSPNTSSRSEARKWTSFRQPVHLTIITLPSSAACPRE